MDQNMEGWTNFYLSKTSKKGPYLTRGKKITHELDKSGFSRHFLSDFEPFRAILSNFKALLDVSSFALNTHI